MRTLFDIKKFWFYLFTGIAFLIIWVFADWHKYPETGQLRMYNNIWRVTFVIVLNYFVFEFWWAFVIQKRQHVIFNILIGFFSFFLVIMIFSLGLYLWRMIGMEIEIYPGTGGSKNLSRATEPQANTLPVQFSFSVSFV